MIVNKSKYTSKSLASVPGSEEDKIGFLFNDNIKSVSKEMENSNENNFEDSEDTFSLKVPSRIDTYLKTQSWNLGKLNLKAIGFKTYFNGYIEDIEIYAEPIAAQINQN